MGRPKRRRVNNTQKESSDQVLTEKNPTENIIVINDNIDNSEEPNTSDLQQSGQKRKAPHVYSIQDDIDILFAVRDVKPFGKNSTETAWTEVHEQILHINTDWRSKKNRFLSEVKFWKANDNKCKRGSGIVEHYEQKDVLMTELVPLMQEAEIEKCVSTSDRKKRSQDKLAGEEIRQAALTTLSEKLKITVTDKYGDSNESDDCNYDTPPRKSKGQDILALLKLKETANQKIREEELEIKREKLTLLQAEKASEVEERKRKLDLEERRLALEERKLEFEMLKYKHDTGNN